MSGSVSRFLVIFILSIFSIAAYSQTTKVVVIPMGEATDPNLVDTRSGDAVAGDIVDGKKAWVDGSELTGTLVVPIAGDTYLAGVAKTGQTTCYTSSGVEDLNCSIAGTSPGADGDIQAGVVWPVPRFNDLGNGTVKDNLTGLIWLQNANCSGTFPRVDGKMTFPNALNFVDTLNNNQLLSDCGDSNHNDDWRVPNRFELESLLDLSQGEAGMPDTPSLSVGHPFTNVEVDDYYWSSSYSSYFRGLGVGWTVSFAGGDVASRSWTLHSTEFPSHSYVWPVRGGVQ